VFPPSFRHANWRAFVSVWLQHLAAASAEESIVVAEQNDRFYRFFDSVICLAMAPTPRAEPVGSRWTITIRHHQAETGERMTIFYQ
jgi:hypothetical protein